MEQETIALHPFFIPRIQISMEAGAGSSAAIRQGKERRYTIDYLCSRSSLHTIFIRNNAADLSHPKAPSTLCCSDEPKENRTKRAGASASGDERDFTGHGAGAEIR